MNEEIVSLATIKNWEKSGINEEEKLKRLTGRANKRFSSKKIVPNEYFSNKNNKKLIEKIKKYETKEKKRDIIYTLAVNFLRSNNLLDEDFSSDNNYLLETLKSFRGKLIEDLLKIDFPKDEVDFLGGVYQSLLQEGTKNINGSYYTPKILVNSALETLKPMDKFLDPCCGTGSFLLSAASKINNPEQIYGYDVDADACFIAAINLIVKFKNIVFKPNIFNVDFLAADVEKNFDVIATNPPWGAMFGDKYKSIYPEISSKESFSYFILKSKKLLKHKGKACFVLPESILNVSCHKDIRKFILENFAIPEIVIYKNLFEGVLSNVVLMSLENDLNNDEIKIVSKSGIKNIKKSCYLRNKDYRFTQADMADCKLLDKIFSTNYDTLKQSLWGLGIVTGNNQKYISSSPKKSYEKIYTGKDIEKYHLKEATKYILFDRLNFQQVASDEIYRAKEKLVYKFVSKKLVFACDVTSSLFLNSANILIPKVKTHSTKTVMAYLNSTLFEFLYQKMFNELKILKGNLSELPFTLITEEGKIYLEGLVDDFVNTGNKKYFEEIDEFVFKSYKLNKDDIFMIKSEVGRN